jgi:hypothetical protein
MAMTAKTVPIITMRQSMAASLREFKTGFTCVLRRK